MFFVRHRKLNGYTITWKEYVRKNIILYRFGTVTKCVITFHNLKIVFDWNWEKFWYLLLRFVIFFSSVDLCGINMTEIVRTWKTQRELWPSASRQVVVHVSGNHKLAIAHITSSYVYTSISYHFLIIILNFGISSRVFKSQVNQILLHFLRTLCQSEVYFSNYKPCHKIP